MKKLWIPILGAIAILGLSSCTNNVNHISFEWNGETVEIDKSMQAKEVFKLIKRICESDSYDEQTLSLSPSLNAPFQITNKTYRNNKYTNYYYNAANILNESYEETYDDIYKQYNAIYDQTDDSITQHASVQKNFHSKKEETEKKTDEYLDFYGVQATLTPGQEGYEDGDLTHHYKEETYSIGNYGYSTEKKNKTLKYCNSFSDTFSDYDNLHSFAKVRDLLSVATYNYRTSIYFLDDVDASLSKYIQYSYELTDKVIRLKYHLDFDSNLAFMILNSFDDYKEIFLEEIEEKQNNGNYFDVIVEIKYPSSSNEYLSVSMLKEINVSITKENGVYDSSVADSSLVGQTFSRYEETQTIREFEHLSLGQKEVYKLRDELINKVEKEN